MKTSLYTITTLTNLHAGSGDANFGIIDNQVQRDSITNFPNINSSSLKGAFREHFTQFDANGMINYIFGPENTSDESHQTGAYSFFEAQLLTRPVRSNVKSHFNVTSKSIIKNLLQTIEDFKIDFDDEIKKELEKLLIIDVKKGSPVIFETINDAYLEDVKAISNKLDISKLKEFLGDDLALFDDIELAELDLPVVARNALEDGISQNLWYEEFVPKKTKFFFCIGKPTNKDAKDNEQKIEGFERRFDNEEIIQIGANKSIGYGFCKIKEFKKGEAK